MAINTSLLIAAPMLQDALIDDATGLPLIGGVITCYQDNSRTTLKNWYYQSGTPGNYSYITLPNPLTLNAAGAITDGNGNDTIPFFYPYSEVDNVTPQPYYITVQDSNGHSKFVRQNFPFNPSQSIVNTVNATLKNYIVNNVFWRNNATSQLTLTNSTQATLAPSIHQGILQPDITFNKSTTGAVDKIQFNTFPAGSFLSSTNPQNLDVTPEYYLNFQCTSAGSETYKYIQFPLSLHLKTMDSVPATITVWLRCNSSSSSGNQVVIQVYQYAGAGTSSSVTKVIKTLTLPNDAAWHKYEFAFTMPPASGISLGSAGDDCVFIQFAYATGGSNTFNIDLSKPSFYIGNQAPTNDIELYDQQEAIFNSARTGDIRTSLNPYFPFGWVQMNDGVISNSGSFILPSGVLSSRANQDTWALFNLLWGIAKPHDTGSNSNPICQLYTNAGVTTNYGTSAIADFSINSRQMQIPFSLGRVLLNLPPVLSVTYNRSITPSWNQSNYGGSPSAVAGLFTATSNLFLYPGAPVYLTGTMPASGNFTTNILYYAIPDPTGGGTTFQLASNYVDAINLNAISAGAASDNGSNIVVNFALGGTFGQSSHVQYVPELASHLHSFVLTASPASNSIQGGVGWGVEGSNTGLTGNNQALNIVQPSVYMNMFIKL